MKLSLRSLRRRYGRARGHLPLSRLSLAAYERKLAESLHYLGVRAAVLNEDERMMQLRGWENGKKPITIAIAIQRMRQLEERSRR